MIVSVCVPEMTILIQELVMVDVKNFSKRGYFLRGRKQKHVLVTGDLLADKPRQIGHE